MEADGAVVDRYKPRGRHARAARPGASLRGLVGAFREEAAFRQELALAVVVIPLGLWLGHTGSSARCWSGPMLLMLDRGAPQQRHRGDRGPHRLRAARPGRPGQGHRLGRRAHVVRAAGRGLAARSARPLDCCGTLDCRTRDYRNPMRLLTSACLLALVSRVRATAATVAAAPSTSRAAAAARPPAQQGPSQPLPAQAPPAPPPGAAQQAAQVAQQAAAVEGNPDWAVTLERIASSVVSIDIDATRAFDTEWNATAQATGFVVDAERGLILTNRHVVTPGPGDRRGHVPQPRGSAALPGVSRSGARLRHLSLRPEASCASSSRRRCRCTRKARRSAARSASSATTPASSCRSSPARSRGSIARRPSTASASTTTSTPSTCRRPRAPRAAPPARR